MAKTWRHAVVGVGVVGEWHVRVLSTLANSKLVAVCDLEPAKAKTALEKHKITDAQVFTDQAEMLKKMGDQIDVVHVAVPSGSHMNPVIMALDAKKNVICEKPMEIQLDRIDRMIDAAKRNGVKLAGIFQNRWNPANKALRDAAQENRFGKLSFAGCYTPWYRTDDYYREGGWRGTWKLDGGGAIMNQSVHAIDLLQWIAGPVKSVSAYSASRIHPEIEVEDTLACALQFENGAFGVIMGSTAMYPGYHVRLEIGGQDGMAISEGGLKHFKFRDERDSDKQLLSRLSGEAKSTGGGSSPTDVAPDLHTENIKAILKSWENGDEAETFGPEVRKAVAIILAMYESSRKGGVPIAVK